MTVTATPLSQIPKERQAMEYAGIFLNYIIIKPDIDRSSYWKAGTVALVLLAFIAAVACIKMRGAGWQKLQIPVITASILTVSSLGLYIYCKKTDRYIPPPHTIIDPHSLAGIYDTLNQIVGEQNQRRSNPESVTGKHYLETHLGSIVYALVYLRHLGNNLPDLPPSYSPPERPSGTHAPKVEYHKIVFHQKKEATDPDLQETIYLLTVLGKDQRDLLDQAHTIWLDDGGVDDVSPPQ